MIKTKIIKLNKHNKPIITQEIEAECDSCLFRWLSTYSTYRTYIKQVNKYNGNYCATCNKLLFNPMKRPDVIEKHRKSMAKVKQDYKDGKNNLDWSKGLTKEISESVAKISKANIGKAKCEGHGDNVSKGLKEHYKHNDMWNKGLTKETHSGIASRSEKIKGNIPWNKDLDICCNEHSEEYQEIKHGDKVRNVCLSCHRRSSNDSVKDWREANPDKSKASYDKSNKKIRDNMTDEGRAIRSEYGKQHYEVNSDIIKEKRKEYYCNNKEKCYASSRNTIKKIKENDPERFRRYQKAGEIKRRQAKQNIKEKVSSSDILRWFELYNSTCFNCGITNEKHKLKFNQRLHLDHFKPLSKGHALCDTNVTILCKDCNQDKLNKMPQDFFSEEQLDELVNKKGQLLS